MTSANGVTDRTTRLPWILAAALWFATIPTPAPWRLALVAFASTATGIGLARLRRTSGSADPAAQHAANWRAIIDTATEGIVTIDPVGVIQTVNGAAERLFGYEAGELIGRDVATLMPDPYRSEHDGYVRRYMDTGEARIIGIGREVTGIRKDGSQFPIDLSVGEGHNGAARFFTAVIRDVSERKRLQAQLAQAERLAAVGELSAGVAHEVNNPINTIINSAQLIEDGDDSSEHVPVILAEGQRIADIVKALLQFARDDHDQTQPTSFAEVTTRTMKLLGETWSRHGIEVEVDLPADLPWVQAQPQKLQQVMLNLLINAKHALIASDAQPRRIRIRGRRDADAVVMTVCDNGPGVAAEIRDRVFEPFVTTKRARGGTGLGLSISRGITEAFGGTLQLQENGTADLGGANFMIRLRIADEA